MIKLWNRPLRYVLLFAGLAVVLAGCTGARFQPAAGAKAYPPYRGEVAVLEDFPAPGSFERLGVVVVDGTEQTADARLRARLLEEAARRGANAVVLQGKIKLAPYRDGALQKRLGAFALRRNAG